MSTSDGNIFDKRDQVEDFAAAILFLDEPGETVSETINVFGNRYTAVATVKPKTIPLLGETSVRVEYLANDEVIFSHSLGWRSHGYEEKHKRGGGGLLGGLVGKKHSIGSSFRRNRESIRLGVIEAHFEYIDRSATNVIRTYSDPAR
jgi:hypothetical protein